MLVTNIPRNNYIAFLTFVGLSLFMVLPNIGFLFISVVFLFFGIQKRWSFHVIYISLLLYLAYMLSTKTLAGDGNDYVTYYYNVIDGIYPQWPDNKIDFLFWKIAVSIMDFSPNRNSNTYFFFLTFISLIPLVFIFAHLRKYSQEKNAISASFLFLIIFITSYSFWNLYGNYIRQAWSFSYALGLMVALLERRWFLSLACLFITIFSHSTGLLFAFIIMGGYLCRGMDIKKLGLCVCVFVYSCMLTNFSILRFIAAFMPEHIYSKLMYYTTWSGDNFGQIAVIRIYISLLIVYCFDALCLSNNQIRPKLYSYLYCIFILLVLITSFVADISKVVERLYYPILVLFYLIISIQITSFISYAPNSNKIICYVLLGMFGIPLLILNLNSSLYYNLSFFNGDIVDFVLFNFIKN